jgi:DMSO/TMAO reductase YedYZ molybdopterin-dependent catalytic subunit/cytochrome b subunit of formate dehydrogenase
MFKRMFRHGRWPKTYVRTHWFMPIAFVLLFASGLALVMPQVHTVLIPYLPIIYDFHILLGIVFALALLLPLFYKLPIGKKVRRIDWALSEIMIAALTMSGVVVWLATVFPATWRSIALSLHNDFAYVMAAWILVHIGLRMFSVGAGKVEYGALVRVDYERRQFAKWSLTGLIGMFAVIFLGGTASSASLRQEGEDQVAAGIPVFPEYYTVTGTYPAISPATYRLVVGGMVERKLSLSLADVKRLRSEHIDRNFQCVTGWVVPHVGWTGVPLAEIARVAGAHKDAKYITFYSADGVYTDSLSIEQAKASGVMLAYEIDGHPLPRVQGYPVRLLVPDMYGYKSVKWVNRLEFVATREIGFWEQRGYAVNAYFGSSGSLMGL